MSLLGKVLHFFGIGTPQVQIILEKPTFQKGSFIEGILEIRGGSSEIDLQGIEIDLVETEELFSSKIDKETSVLETVKLHYTDFIIHSASRYEIPFKIKIPTRCSISSPGIEHRVLVNLCIPGWDSTITQVVTISEAVKHADHEDDYFHISCQDLEAQIFQKTGYRVFCWFGGFGATLRDRICLFSQERQLLSTLDYCGIGISIHGSGELFVSWNEKNEVYIVDFCSNKLLYQWQSELPIRQVNWFDDELILLSGDQFYRFSCQGKSLQNNILFSGPHGIGGVTRTPEGRMFFSETRNGYIQEYFPSTGPVGNRFIIPTPEGLSAGSDETLLVVSGDCVILLESKTMQAKQTFKIPGKKGVKCTSNDGIRHWNIYPRINKERSKIALNDLTGQVQILDVYSGKVVCSLDRNIANFVEHLSWLDNNRILLVEASKKIKMIDIESEIIIWEYALT
jgi:hypothetical protein